MRNFLLLVRLPRYLQPYNLLRSFCSLKNCETYTFSLFQCLEMGTLHHLVTQLDLSLCCHKIEKIWWWCKLIWRIVGLKEYEGYRELKEDNNDTIYKTYHEPLKLKKGIIGSEEKPKMESIGDYWDEQIMSKIENLFKGMWRSISLEI